jgi:hypothetical protein
MRRAHARGTIAGMALGVAALLGGRPAGATIQFGNIELSGNFETQNLVRTPDAGEFEFIQNRNTARIRLDWNWLENGRMLGRFDMPFLQDSRFFLLYRGVYDGFYDLAPGGNQTGQSRADDLIGGPIEGNRIGSLRPDGSLRQGAYSRFQDDTRDSLKFENRIRELYIDLTLRDLPLTLRIGRQQVIWGEADQFRLADIWNPLDVTSRFPIADTFDNFRVPLWMIKGIWDTGFIGPLQNTFVEVVYNPFDFQPGQKVDWLPKPWALPFPNPLRPGQIQVASFGTDILVTPIFDLRGTSFKKGDFERNPEDASEVGARFHFVTPQGLESTVNYIYGRGKWVGNSPAFGVKIHRAVGDPSQGVGTFRPLGNTGTPLTVTPAFVEAEVIHPYVHVFGITGNYFESEYTSAVLRFETAYALGEPYPTSDPDQVICATTVLDPETCARDLPVGFEKRDVWAGMIGFDRPTWIRWLNNKATWFVSGQLFWMHIRGHDVKKLRGFSSANADPYFTPGASLPGLDQSGGFGVWNANGLAVSPTGAGIPLDFAGQIERTQDGSKPPFDNALPWEFITTLTMTTFYRGGTVAPQLVVLFDPKNKWLAPLMQLELLYTNSFIITLQQRFIFPLDPPTNDPWFVGRFGRRHESGIRLTYQF